MFFFSSRRRHTRWPRDWSSDVCSSDLDSRVVETEQIVPLLDELSDPLIVLFEEIFDLLDAACGVEVEFQIGRASCRERGEVWEGSPGAQVNIRTSRERRRVGGGRRDVC